MDIYPVILCGGLGARLWPASHPGRPKPFVPVLDEFSLLQHTAMRLVGLPGARPPIVVVGARYATLARRQLADVGVEAFIIAEPEGRDSGPALVAATTWIARTDPSALVLALAADHHIPEAAAFRDSVCSAMAAAESGHIVAFGVRPSFPATAYGYIRAGDPLAGGGGRSVAAFIEKPDAARAEACVAAGYLWNSGNLVFRADILLAEAALHAPGLAQAAARAVDEGALVGRLLELSAAFAAAPASSIDVAVMEKTSRAAVLEIDFAWSDLGSWEAVWAALGRDAAGNAVEGDAVVSGSVDCLIRADAGARIVAIGLKRVAVVVQDDRILVCDLAASGQILKNAVADLGEAEIQDRAGD